ncbi:MAG: DUF47 family protein [Clostridia bacterium]|nr:DUF47 family protein [Clostridia bacterium]
MAKGDKFYFDNFAKTTELAKQAANYLVECLENFDASKIDDMLVKMHEIENDADVQKHQMDQALAKAFVTPVDREDLDMLSHQLDDVVDLIEEVLQKFYIYDISTIKAPAVEFAKNIVKCCEFLYDIMVEFENFKRSKTLYKIIVDLNDLEEDCDKLYLSSMRELTKDKKAVLETISWRDIYESFEACVDACEHASDCVASVIMKNS